MNDLSWLDSFLADPNKLQMLALQADPAPVLQAINGQGQGPMQMAPVVEGAFTPLLGQQTGQGLPLDEQAIKTMMAMQQGGGNQQRPPQAPSAGIPARPPQIQFQQFPQLPGYSLPRPLLGK